MSRSKNYWVLLLPLILVQWGAVLGQVTIGTEVNAGLGAGWWVYNKGFDDAAFHLGYDRTHLAFSLPVELNLWVGKGPHRWLLGGGTRRLVDDIMIGSEHQSWSRRRYLISEESFIRFRELHIGYGYSLVQRPRYQLIPQIRLGHFFFEHIHPGGDAMGMVWQREVGVQQQVWLSRKVCITLEGRYSDWKIAGNSTARRAEEHHIYAVDLRLGLGIKIWEQRVVKK